MVNWWGKKKKDPNTEIANINNTLNSLREQIMKGGSKDMAKQEMEEDEDEDFDDLDDEDEMEEQEAAPKRTLKAASPVAKATVPVTKKRVEVVEEEIYQVVTELPVQQFNRGIAQDGVNKGKTILYETITEALSNIRNDLADIKKAVGA